AAMPAAEAPAFSNPAEDPLPVRSEYEARAPSPAILGRARAATFWRAYEDSYYGPADFAWFAEQGIGLLRLPFNHRHFDDSWPDHPPGRGFDLLQRCLDQAAGHGLLVLLDLHAAPGCQAVDWNDDCSDGVARFWREPALQAQTCELWRAIAERFHDHPALFGYDPLCEPVADRPEALNGFYRACCRAIRSADPSGIITLEPDQWARDAASLARDLFDDPQVIVQSHVYPQQHLPIAGLRSYPDPDAGIDRAALRSILKPTLDQDRIQRPGLIGEFGCHWDRQTPAAHDLFCDFARLMGEDGLHWSLWAGKDLDAMGVLQPMSNSPWRALLERPAIAGLRARLSADFGVSFLPGTCGGRLQRGLQALVHDEPDREAVARASREAKRHVDPLILRAILRTLALLPEDELLDCARGFAFRHCRPHPRAADLLNRTRSGSIPTH
ncbi:MAG: glycoside hydrolase family 5 protein, partial [Planctomycetota bacterium]